MEQSDFKIATLIYIIQDGKILLGLKQRKVAAGLWSGYGGKPESHDNSIYDTAIRELYEETGEGLICEKQNLESAAIIDFTLEYKDQESFYMKVYIFRLESYTGSYVDTIEMKKHTWFSFDKIPYSHMLPDSKVFLPKIIAGECFIGDMTTCEGILIESTLEAISKDDLGVLFNNT